ncbi:HlyD family secretion protein [Vibrio sp. MEBiC08052]|uniref:HlyD family secretion protein n=1 Tax=Vibrio sp. MEBiC08052 TaxID=1761910 RepID=UPI0007407739|nr:efflux RND transporter periplasmic adaptor subunit [Vibrio sp. MEBiC08052]KUJ00662.1 secretion protein HlyD family protein [Vibrio sp. MEBiC08052]
MQDHTNEMVDSPRKGQRKKSLATLLVVILIAAIGVGFYYTHYVIGHQDTEDAYVKGNLVQITPEISGTVTQIAAEDGDYVKQGQVLVHLDDADAKLAFENATANLAQTVRKVRGLFNNVQQAKAVVEERKIALNKAKTDFDRRKNMVAAGGLSQEELSHAQDMMNSAEKALAVAEQQLKSQQAMIHNTTVETHPLVKTAIAKIKQTYLEKQRTQLVAPVSGYIARRNVQVGQRVSQSSILMAVVPLESVWVDANFKETQLTDMRIGQPVILTSDLYGDDVVFHGTIESLGIGTGSAFSILPAQNATGNWIKVVQRLPVRIQLDKEDVQKHPLRIGLSMKVDVDISDTSGQLLSQSTPETPRYQTNVYNKMLDGVDQLIGQIITENDIATEQYIANQ